MLKYFFRVGVENMDEKDLTQDEKFENAINRLLTVVL